MKSNQERFRSLIKGEDGALILKGFETSSVSAIDADARAQEWDATFAVLDEMVEERNYAAGSPGFSAGGFHGVDFFDATVAAVIKSYAGIFAVERNLDQPNASLPYFNSYGVKTGNLITPNLGTSNTMVENSGYYNVTFTVLVADMANPVVLSTVAGSTQVIEAIPVVPGSVKVTMVYDGAKHVFTDDGNGNLIAPAGILSAGTVTYGFGNVNLPEINFTSPTAAAATSDTDIIVEFVQDQPAVIGEALKGEIQYYRAETSAIIVPYEINQITNLSAKKSLRVNMRQMTLDQVTNEYTKIVNKRVADQIKLSATVNNEVQIDLSTYSTQTSDFRTYLESFMGQLKMIDTAMGRKTEKATKITAYLVSLNLGDIFRQLDFVTSKWVPNKDISYIDDIVGYYDEIPVVRSKWIEDAGTGIFQGYAVHKAKEGHLAPLMRGMYLPLTTMNEVGSFNNPLLKTGGIFSYEGMSKLTNDLTIGFTVLPGTGTVTVQ